MHATERRQKQKRLALWLVVWVAMSVAVVLSICSWVESFGRGRRHPPQLAPATEVALVLGASPGRVLDARVDAACALVELGKVERLLLSGLPRELPSMRARALRCVDADRLLIDDTATRTRDSLVTARSRFFLTEVLLVSQAYHLPRALYLADHVGLVAAGVVAEGQPTAYHALREQFAQVRAFIDVHAANAYTAKP